jgi:hypothetical protein
MLFPSIALVDSNEKTYRNAEIIKLTKKEVDSLATQKPKLSKKKFEKYKQDVEKNKNSPDKLKEIEKELNNDTIELATESVIAKKIFFSDVWQSSFLRNSRTAHKNASGSKRNLDGFFIVGGERFRYCGDWTYASISNVINCRCYLINNY